MYTNYSSPVSLIVFVLFCIGCSSMKNIQDVPAALRNDWIYFESSTTKIDSRKYAVDEGFIVVYENPADSSSRRIKLPVRRIRAADPKPSEPIFWFNGGPGMTNMKYDPPSALLEKHDVVLVGYRGVDGSTVLQSDIITKAVKGAGDDLFSTASMENISSAVGSFASDMREQGIDLAQYSIVNVISDFEKVREAFGYEKINLLSASYGTRVALLYGYLHPDVLAHSVMFGANPPGRFVFDPKTIDEQLRYYDRLYAESHHHEKDLSLVAMMKSVLVSLPARWTIFKLDPGKIRVATFAMLYHKNTAAIVFDCYRAASEGDYSGMYALQLAYDFTLPSMMVWGDLLAKGASADYDASFDYIARLNDEETTLGSPLALLIWGGAAGSFPVALIPTELRSVQTSSVPTLIVSGSIDFSTPAEYASRELLPSLPNGTQLILKEMGHINDLFSLQPEAVAHLLVQYFDEGIVDDSQFIYDPMNFHPPIDVPLWTKVLYPFVAVASIFL